MNKLSDEERIRKAKAYGNSRPLDVWRVSDYPEVKSLIKHIFSEMEAEGLTNTRYEKKLKNHIRCIILDLFVAYMAAEEMYIAYSRNPNNYKQGSRYAALFLGYRNVIKVVDFLIAKGYVENVRGVNVRDGSGRRSYQSRMRGTYKLIGLIKDNKVTLPMIKHDENEPLIILRDENGDNIEYEDTIETTLMKKRLKIINRNLEKHAILLYIWDEDLKLLNEKLAGDSKRKPIDFTKKRLRRIFNNSSFQQGGRFYGVWWQEVLRECRKYIRINGKHVVECDYSGLHINMLYAKDKLPMPEGDVYYLEGYSNDEIFRNFVKRMLLIMVNAGSRELVRQALHEAVHKKKNLELPKEINTTRGEDLFPLMDVFEQKHDKIKHYFCTGIGIDLQYLDSQIAEKVMLQFTKGTGYAILPLHDSFIIHHGCEEALNISMRKAFYDVFGVECEVDLKYNSMSKRFEESAEYKSMKKRFQEKEEEYDPESDVSKLSLNELLDLDAGITGDYRIHSALLSGHRRDLDRQDKLKETGNKPATDT